MQAQTIGIGKRQLLEDYYPDELEALFEEYGIITHASTDKDTEEEVDLLTFFGVGGGGDG